MAKNSVFIRAILWVYGVFAESKAAEFVYGFLHGVFIAVRGSMPGRILTREKGVEQYAAHSVFYRTLSGIWNGFLSFFGKIYAWLSRVNTGSVNRKIFDSVLQNSYLLHLETLVFLSVFVIFIVPHTFWNNLYATILTVGLCVLYFVCLQMPDKMLFRQI